MDAECIGTVEVGGKGPATDAAASTNGSTVAKRKLIGRTWDEIEIGYVGLPSTTTHRSSQR